MNSEHKSAGGDSLWPSRYVQAKPLLIQSYEALRDVPGLAPLAKKEMLEQIALLYKLWNTPKSKKHNDAWLLPMQNAFRGSQITTE